MKISHKGLRHLLAAHPHWRASATGSGHVKLTSSTGTIVYTGGTPSNWHGLKNLRAQLRRADRANG
jgi:hypothetical protein